MGMQFEYDEKGTTFYYFILSFIAIFLIPATYYFFPDEKKSSQDKDDEKKPCYCPPCMAKTDLLTKTEPKQKTIKFITRAALILMWALLVFGVVKVSQFEKEYGEYNPYDILKLEPGASKGEIKKQYRDLSLILHPDRGGDPVEFMKVAKAYKALTDEEAKENWDKYGNPDGPGATQFGIALPSWIVDKKNSMWVLGAYMLAFIVILPIVVGTWWYRSIQYSADEVLMDTEQLFWYFLHRTPNMSLKRAIMILAGSLEFDKFHNKEIQERPSDNIELPKLIKELPHLNEKNKERPLCYPYSIKARSLLHAHFSRIALPQQTLLKDLEYILKKCPYLIKEMINIVGQLIYLSKHGRVAKPPRLETIEHLIKLSQMLIQGVWDSKSSFLMLPHIQQDQLRHFHTKKRSIKNIQQFLMLNNVERRLLLRTLSDEQYEDVMNVCASFPFVEIDVKTKVIDDEDMHTVTCGATVTAIVTLTRKSMTELIHEDGVVEGDATMLANGDLLTENDENNPSDSPRPGKQVVWQRKVKKGKGAKKKQPPKKNAPKKKEEESKKEEENAKLKDGSNIENEKEEHEDDNENDEVDNISGDNIDSSEDEEKGGDGDDKGEGADEEWEAIKDDELINQEKLLEVKSKESHIVHCPYFPVEKHEYWWVYIVSKKKEQRQLLSPPQLVTNLKEQEEVQVKFNAPEKTGIYYYLITVRSDSYVEFDITKTLKVEVCDAKEFDPGTHWDYSSDEEEKDDSGESVYETEDEDDEED